MPRRTIVLALSNAAIFLFEYGLNILGQECVKLAIACENAVTDKAQSRNLPGNIDTNTNSNTNTNSFTYTNTNININTNTNTNTNSMHSTVYSSFIKTLTINVILFISY